MKLLSGDVGRRTAWGMESDQKLGFDELSMNHRTGNEYSSIFCHHFSLPQTKY
jgi:hypothetical protein